MLQFPRHVLQDQSTFALLSQSDNHWGYRVYWNSHLARTPWRSFDSVSPCWNIFGTPWTDVCTLTLRVGEWGKEWSQLHDDSVYFATWWGFRIWSWRNDWYAGRRSISITIKLIVILIIFSKQQQKSCARDRYCLLKNVEHVDHHQFACLIFTSSSVKPTIEGYYY